ncbi:hypothetical protein Dimus_029682 [Dionaea muscipula]
MRESEKKKISNNNPVKRSARTQRKDSKLLDRSERREQNSRETESKALQDKPAPNAVVNDRNAGVVPFNIYENMVVGSQHDVYRKKDLVHGCEAEELVGEDGAQTLDGPSAELNMENLEVKEVLSDSERTIDSATSQGDSLTADEQKIERKFSIHKKQNMDSDEVSASASTLRTSRKPMESQLNGVALKYSSNNTSEDIVGSISVSSQDKPIEESEGETFSEALNGDEDLASDGEPSIVELNALHQGWTFSKRKDSNVVTSNENGTKAVNNDDFPAMISMNQKIEEMETRIEKLEEELREVAALEISLYTVVPEHGSSAHKVHTPARRLSRLYIHACKHWTQSKRGTIARNTVSGLVLVARTCGNDVSRLTFWLSNTVVLREIIAQAFGSSTQSNVMRIVPLNGSGKVTDQENPSPVNFKGRPVHNQMNKKGVTQFVEDWQETGTFTSALEKVETWIFSRIVESVWWQALTPHMQSPLLDLTTKRSISRPLGSAPGDQKQGSFSIDLWRGAFMDAFHRLCPVRAGGHACGCLPVLARMVIAQCVARLDIAMFNAILRESEHEIPSDPVSDPIVDARVLPIPAGNLSFGFGAQLKNVVGNWSRCLGDLFGVEVGYRSDGHHVGSEYNDHKDGHARPKYFHLLDELSDLLMLPKDMLADWSIRKEVCPCISLPLVKRIVCNFTPDEFCPDHVPGEVLEVLNAESIVERRLSESSTGNFPYAAAPVVYSPPSTADVAEKVAEAGGKPLLEHNASSIQRKGYTSDEELEDLDSPLAYIVDNLRSSSPGALQLQSVDQGLEQAQQIGHGSLTARYKLLHEVWSV